jgi:signal transduction histidine kinase
MSSGSKPNTLGMKRELAALHRQLKREIKLRLGAQEALASSKRHRDQLLERSRRMENQFRRLTHELLSAQEEERKKISRELHDEIGQILTAVNVKLAALTLETTVSTASFNKRIASTQRLVEKSMSTVHRFARELRPPLLDDLGLVPALRSYLNSFAKRTRLSTHLTVFAGIERLDNDRRTVLYRVAQEALTNVDKHAEASSVRVSVRRLRGAVQMDIHDDGKSFPIERALSGIRTKRLGLIGMRERVEMVGGTFMIESAPGRGTTVCAKIPFRSSRR